MYENGAGDDEICKELRIPRKEFQRRYADDPIFAKLVDYGHVARKAWFLKQGRLAITDGAKPQAYQFWMAYMKAEYGWGAEATGDGRPVSEKSTDEIKSRVMELTKKLRMSPELSDIVN